MRRLTQRLGDDIPIWLAKRTVTDPMKQQKIPELIAGCDHLTLGIGVFFSE